MRQIFKLLLFVLPLCLFSCEDNTVDPDDIVVSNELIEVPNVTMLPDEGEKQVTVSANCAWVITVPESDSWLSINPKMGSNSQTITISCLENTSINSRTSVVTISGKQRTTAFQVTQNACEIVPVTISNFNLGVPTTNSVEYSFSLSPVSDDIITCGVCCSTTNTVPTIDDGVSAGIRSGSTVNGTLSSLKANTTYYIRAFVTNPSGTYYSQTKETTTINDVPGSGDNLPPTNN